MVLPNFKENLEKYAKLLVANGINVQPGHALVLNIDVEQRELAHLIVKEAYALGAHEVIVQWADDFITREKFLHAPMDRLDNVPDYKIAEMNYFLEHKANRLGVRSSDPGALNGVDAEKLSASAKALGMAMKPMRIATQSNKVSWTVAAAAGLEWAKKSSQMRRATKKQWISFGIKSSRPAGCTKKIQSRLGKSMRLFSRARQRCLIKNNSQPFITQHQAPI